MLPETVLYLASNEGKELFELANRLFQARSEPARAIATLRKTGKNAESASAAWELARLRPRAIAKLGALASGLIFDRDGYEMASSASCSRHHADIVAGWNCAHIVDLCAGIGIDTIAMAARGIRVTAYETDPARAEMIRCNAAAAGLSYLVDVRCEDVMTAKFPVDATAAFFDPARRTDDKRRMYDPEALIPPLSFIGSLHERGIGRILVKLAPATDSAIGAVYGGAVEYVSDGGECKEALLRVDGVALPCDVSAVLLPAGIIVKSESASDVRVDARPGAFLYEPDAAIIRSGLVGEVVARVDGWLFEAGIAYVMADRAIDVPFATRYVILEAMPFHGKHVQQALERWDAGRLVVKKRGVDVEPERVARQFKLPGDKELTLIVTRSGKAQWAFIAERRGLVE